MRFVALVLLASVFSGCLFYDGGHCGPSYDAFWVDEGLWAATPGLPSEVASTGPGIDTPWGPAVLVDVRHEEAVTSAERGGEHGGRVAEVIQWHDVARITVDGPADESRAAFDDRVVTFAGRFAPVSEELLDTLWEGREPGMIMWRDGHQQIVHVHTTATLGAVNLDAVQEYVHGLNWSGVAGVGYAIGELGAWKASASLPVRHLDVFDGATKHHIRFDAQGKAEFWFNLPEEPYSDDVLTGMMARSLGHAGLPAPTGVEVATSIC